VGLGIRLSREEHRRLEELARATGRTPAGVIGRWLRAVNVRDAATLAMLREGTINRTEVNDDAGF